MERIPVLMEQVESLKRGQQEIRQDLHDEIKELKAEHINRLWMAFDEMRRTLGEINSCLAKIKGSIETKIQFSGIIFALLSASISGLGVWMFFHGRPG